MTQIKETKPILRVVCPIKGSCDIPSSLRMLADDIESGEIECDNVTVIANYDIRHFGPVDDCRAVEQAVFNCEFAKSKLMKYALKEDD